MSMGMIVVFFAMFHSCHAVKSREHNSLEPRCKDKVINKSLKGNRNILFLFLPSLYHLLIGPDSVYT